jgi:hypothetical protein
MYVSLSPRSFPRLYVSHLPFSVSSGVQTFRFHASRPWSTHTSPTCVLADLIHRRESGGVFVVRVDGNVIWDRKVRRMCRAACDKRAACKVKERRAKRRAPPCLCDRCVHERAGIFHARQLPLLRIRVQETTPWAPYPPPLAQRPLSRPSTCKAACKESGAQLERRAKRAACKESGVQGERVPARLYASVARAQERSAP